MLTLPTKSDADLCTIFLLRLYNMLPRLNFCFSGSSIVIDNFTLRGSAHAEGFQHSQCRSSLTRTSLYIIHLHNDILCTILIARSAR